MQVDAPGEVGQGAGPRPAAPVQELLHVVPAGGVEGGGELAVHRVLHRHVQDGAPLVHDGVELGLHLLRLVAAGEGAADPAGLREQIAPGGGGDFQPPGSEQGHVPHDDLPAYRQLPGQGGGAHRPSGLGEPAGDGLSALLGVHGRFLPPDGAERPEVFLQCTTES